MKFKTPNQLGYSMPAEWHPHAATLMHWPSNRETWPGKRLERVEEVYLNIIEKLSRYEPVILLSDPSTLRRAKKRIENTGIDRTLVRVIEKPINDVWARDCGPICIRREVDGSVEYAMTDWDYNAWGNKYPPFDDDNKVPSFLADIFGMPLYRPGIVLEGGSIETNGHGLLLTTESVLLNPNRNPGLDKGAIEQYLQDFLGIDKIIWLKRGLAGDDTDGHIDDLTRFLNKDTVLTIISEDNRNVNFDVLNKNYELLESACDLQDRPLTIETLPLPETKIEGTTVDGSEHVPASYANFYIANGVVLVPQYDRRFDNMAIDLFRGYYPERDIIGIECADLVWGQGSLHCITQQLYGINTGKLKNGE